MAKRIITISREFGSGGRFIGEEVAKKLGIAYYDKNVINDSYRGPNLYVDVYGDIYVMSNPYSRLSERKKYGDEQVKIWRRSASVRPPLLNEEDDRYPGRDDKYKDLKKSELPLGECLMDTLKRVIDYYETEIKKSLRDIYEMKYEVMKMAGDFRGRRHTCDNACTFHADSHCDLVRTLTQDKTFE